MRSHVRSRTAALWSALTALALAGSLGLLSAPASGAARAAQAGPGTGQTINVLVLGDSYSAGNGGTDSTSPPEAYGPQGCYRNTVNWGERYASGLRAQGYTVNLSNHACSGGVTADFTNPRVMDTQSGKTTPAPSGVTTTSQADSYLSSSDPCNTHQFPDEEFWTYHANSVSGGTINYDCTRNIRPQADFITPATDLVLFTNGGNDAGFTTIVTQCFLIKSGSGCKTAIDSARALLPEIKNRLIAGINAFRAHGLRDDAKIVQLGYPWLQFDNDYKIVDLTTPALYHAGNEVRSLVTDGDNQIATVPASVNAGHPGQMSFLAGVPEKFSGHEPDATTPAGNPARWIRQIGDGTTSSFYYHPNALGQQAYADLLLARGTQGAPTHRAAPASSSQSILRAHARRAHVRAGRPIVVVGRVVIPGQARPRGRIVVRKDDRARVVAAKRLRPRTHGRFVLRVRHLKRGAHSLAVTYRGPGRAPVTVRVPVRVG